MLGALLIAGAIGALAGAVIHAYWDHIIRWLAKVSAKIKSVLNIAVDGYETFIQRVGAGFKNMSENYSKLPGGKWRKDTVIEQSYIPENDVPEEIKRAMLAANNIEGTKINTTLYLEKQVLTLSNS